MSALGLIETIGLVAAIEGLDAALKSANVETIGCEFVGSGIVTVKIRGEIGAVKAAIEAAEAAVNRVGTLRATHVIARMSDDIIGMIENKNATKEEVETEVDVVEEVSEKVIENINNETEVNNDVDKEVHEDIQLTDEEINKKYTQEELQAMRVSELRTVARALKTKLTRKKIKFAKKDELIEAILEVMER